VSLLATAEPVASGADVRLGGRRLLILLFLLTLPLVTARLRGADEIEYFSYLPSLVFDQDLDFENEYRHFVDRDPESLRAFEETFLDRREPLTGRPINFAPLGTALLWSPFYLLAHLGVLAARALGAAVEADGLSRPYVAAVSLGSAVYGWLGLLLAHHAVRRVLGVGEPAAAWAVAGIALGTPVLYYVTLAPGFSHAASLFTIALVLCLSLRAAGAETTGVRTWAALGAAVGLCALVREQDGLLGLVPGVLLLRELARRRAVGDFLGKAVALGGTTLLVFLPQLLAYRAVNGTWGPSKLVVRKMSWSSPHLLEVLLSPGHGLFVWAPLLLVAVLGLLLGLREPRTRLASGLLLVAFASQAWINGAVESWSQAGAFGSRRFVGLSFAFAWGLALVLDRLRPRAASALLVAFFALWNVGLMIQFGLKLMDRQRLEWPRVAVNQVTEVPRRLGRTAWLFFTDREALVRESR
jgi:hypothetical protein